MNIGNGRVVIDCFGESAVYDTKFLGNFGGVREEFADPNSLVIVVFLFEFILGRAKGKGLLPRGHSGDARTWWRDRQHLDRLGHPTNRHVPDLDGVPCKPRGL